MPLVYVLVDSIDSLGDVIERRTTPYISPTVFFTSQMENIKEEGISAFSTFSSCQSNSIEELDRVTENLTKYAERYQGKIITNFDQQRPMFENVPFSLQSLMDGRIDKERLIEFNIQKAEIVCDKINQIHTEVISMSKNEINIGSGTTIYGNVIAAKAIRNSFNKIDSATIPSELQDLLKELATEIENLSKSMPEDSARQVARDLETLTSEVTSGSPRKEWWQLSLDGLKKAAINLGEIGKPVIELVTKIIPLLQSISS